jgi:hypothetical protein
MSSFDESERQSGFPKRGPDEYLTSEERKFIQRYLSFPEDFPATFRSWVVQENLVNLQGISKSQIEGLSSSLGFWQSYTPTLTGSVSNPTLGSGATQAGRYVRIGNTIHGVARIFVGTSYVNGSGDLRLSLPLAPTSLWQTTPFVVGNGHIYDYSGAGTRYVVSAQVGTGTFALLNHDTAVTVTYASPITLADSDNVALRFTYEVA